MPVNVITGTSDNDFLHDTIRRDRIPSGFVEEINAVGKREMETARAMAFLVALANRAQGRGGFTQGIGGF